MGKAGGLQRVLRDLRLFPVAFEWEGAPDARPVLKAVTLVKWDAV
jgi:hypothetical protein